MVGKLAYIDCSAGVSASMLLAALLDAGLDTDKLKRILFSVPQFDVYRLKWQRFRSPVATGTMMEAQPNRREEGLSVPEWHFALEESSTLPTVVVTKVLATLQCIEDASRATRGAVPSVQFSALDMAEICAVLLGFHLLHIQDIYCSELPILSTTSPVTIEIGRNANLYWRASERDVSNTTCNEIGVALLATLAHYGNPIMRIERAGHGYVEFFHPHFTEDKFGVAHLYVGYEPGTQAHKNDSDQVVVIETNIDNMSGELLGALMERLLAAGALDVTYTPIQMKKDRPATMVTVICPPKLSETLSLILLRETSTLGVRTQLMTRLIAQREQVQIETALGPTLVKVKRVRGEFISASPEYEECQRLAQENGIPLIEVYEIVRDAIRKSDVSQNVQ
ncbi:UPF0272 protein [Ktedonobacteria bacterium brp13]|nr:UPF0272 protein [Ktedonobacteria bacterium brp13]